MKRAMLAAGMAVLMMAAAPSAASAKVVIHKIRYDPPGSDYTSSSQLRAEYVVIHNTASHRKSLRGWLLHDRSGHRYHFGPFKIGAGAYVKVHTGSGQNDRNDRYWGMSNFVWNNDGDKATLVKRSGRIADSCSYAGGESPNPPKYC